MDATPLHVLMTESDPTQDLALQRLIAPYNIKLTFCMFDAGTLLAQLRHRSYDAVVVRCTSSDLPCTALLSMYHLSMCTNTAALSPKASIPFLAVLPAPNPTRAQALQHSGYAAVLYQPVSEYRLATALMDHIRYRNEKLAAQQRSLYSRFSELLLLLGCPAHLQGFNYLCCCLVYLAEAPEALHQLTQVLYPKVAANFNTSAGNLERAMRTALDYMEQYGSELLFSELLPARCEKNTGRRRRFCTSELLAAILRYSIRLDRPG